MCTAGAFPMNPTKGYLTEEFFCLYNCMCLEINTNTITSTFNCLILEMLLLFLMNLFPFLNVFFQSVNVKM